MLTRVKLILWLCVTDASKKRYTIGCLTKELEDSRPFIIAKFWRRPRFRTHFICRWRFACNYNIIQTTIGDKKSWHIVCAKRFPWHIYHYLLAFTAVCTRPEMMPTPNDPRHQMIPKIDLNTTRNDPRPRMIPNFFHTRPEMIPRWIIGMEWDDVLFLKILELLE